MNKLMYQFVATTKEKKNRPVFRHGMPPQGIPRKYVRRCGNFPRLCFLQVNRSYRSHSIPNQIYYEVLVFRIRITLAIHLEGFSLCFSPRLY